MYVKESAKAETSLALQKTFGKNGENTLLVSLRCTEKLNPDCIKKVHPIKPVYWSWTKVTTMEFKNHSWEEESEKEDLRKEQGEELED
jgi:hypothetical protein